MRILLPFPKCHKCGEDSPKSILKSCGGTLFIETTTDDVYCSKCCKQWNVWDSKYYCSCGNVFEAKEIQDTLTEVLVFCRICAEEVLLQNQAKRERITTSEKSLRVFLGSFLERLGYSLGVAVGVIIETVSSIFFKK